VFSIASGLIAGKEGPFVHGGAIVGGGVGSMGSQCDSNHPLFFLIGRTSVLQTTICVASKPVRTFFPMILCLSPG
jgi:H+/Cl- antiporter ClcA